MEKKVIKRSVVWVTLGLSLGRTSLQVNKKPRHFTWKHLTVLHFTITCHCVQMIPFKYNETGIKVPASHPETAQQPAWPLPVSPLSPSKSYWDFPTPNSPGKKDTSTSAQAAHMPIYQQVKKKECLWKDDFDCSIYYLINALLYHRFIRFPAGSHKLCSLVLNHIKLFLQSINLLLKSLQE